MSIFINFETFGDQRAPQEITNDRAGAPGPFGRGSWSFRALVQLLKNANIQPFASWCRERNEMLKTKNFGASRSTRSRYTD